MKRPPPNPNAPYPSHPEPSPPSGVERPDDSLSAAALPDGRDPLPFDDLFEVMTNAYVFTDGYLDIMRAWLRE